ncbi:TIGR03862 family flavoprotein [uncultured Devosia sp.]|uniref:TIGR03862 family flavoprotein n=1 Tax=uncultured Devosia sp. TaxID=211434 RepID=UPI002639E800|nr:TIGR03862 family flavoprotein [uncultured Devosia sp.]
MSVNRIAVIGGGPAGLMAAEMAAMQGARVSVYEALPSVGRKLLMAGKSGLNITHAEDKAAFDARYGLSRGRLQQALDVFPAAAVREWCAGLAVETFVGSSGRVFPSVMKASPLLRAWLGRLDGLGVTILTRHRWQGFEGRSLVFDTPEGRVVERFDAVVLALGGASWPRLGSDAAWVPWLVDAGVPVSPFRPANCGFEVDWSDVMVERFAGQPVKSVVARSAAGAHSGEFVVTRWGVEGSLVYAHAAALRDSLETTGQAVIELDLVPGRTAERLARDLARQPAKASFANRLRKGAGLDGVKLALLRECLPNVVSLEPEALAAAIKSVPLAVQRPRPIAEAISVAGGVAWDGVDEHFMLKALPGVFVAGEMLDWEAPTGGYLLTACFATGRAAGLAAAKFVPGGRDEQN